MHSHTLGYSAPVILRAVRAPPQGFTAVVGAIFPIAASASIAASFGFFGAVIGVGTAFVYFYLPETANLTILQIDTVVSVHVPMLRRPGYCGAPLPPKDSDTVASRSGGGAAAKV